MPVLQMFYASRAAEPFTVAEIKRLIGEAQLRNRRADVTGVLAFTGAYFAQVLEGPPPVVEHLVSRIANDPRHRDFRVLRRENEALREFPDWGMALLESPRLETTLAALTSGEAPHLASAVEDALARIKREVRWQSVSLPPQGDSWMP